MSQCLDDVRIATTIFGWSGSSPKLDRILDQVESGVKRNFRPLQNFWPVIVCQLFCFSE